MILGGLDDAQMKNETDLSRSIERRLGALPKDRLSTPRIIGFMLYCTWVLAVFYSTFLYQSGIDFRGNLYLNLFTSLTALTLILGLFPKLVKHADKWVLSKRVIYPSTAVMASATAVLAFANNESAIGFALIITSGIITGGTSGVLFLGWFRVFSDAGTRTALVEVALSWALAALICIVLCFLPAIASTVLLLGATVASGLLLRRSAMNRPSRPLPARAHRLHKRTRKMFGRGLFATLSFGVVAGFSDVISGFRYVAIPESYGVFLLMGAAIAASMALAIALWSAGHNAIIYTYRLTFMLVALGCMSTPFMQQTGNLSNIIIFGGYVCFSIVLMSICIDISNYFDVPATKAFGYAFCAMYAGEVLGSGAGHLLTMFAPNQNVFSIVSFLLTGAVLFANLFMFTEKDLIETSIGEMTDNDTCAESASTPFDDNSEAAARAIAQRYKLTARESEVLPLIIKGRTIARIQEELFISQGTVSTHTRHIYQKVGVKNRQELLDLIDEMKDQ